MAHLDFLKLVRPFGELGDELGFARLEEDDFVLAHDYRVS